MFTNADITFQLANQHRADLIAEADQFRLLAAARRALRGRHTRKR